MPWRFGSARKVLVFRESGIARRKVACAGSPGNSRTPTTVELAENKAGTGLAASRAADLNDLLPSRGQVAMLMLQLSVAMARLGASSKSSPYTMLRCFVSGCWLQLVPLQHCNARLLEAKGPVTL
jgi:hypothetical protein